MLHIYSKYLCTALDQLPQSVLDIRLRSRGSQNAGSEWIFGSHLAQILTYFHFPEKRVGVRGRGRFAQGHAEGGLISVFLQAGEQAISSLRKLHEGLPGWREAKPLASTVLIAVAMAAAHYSPPRLGDVRKPASNGKSSRRHAQPRRAPPSQPGE